MKKKLTIERFQSADTGEFVTKRYASRHPHTTFLHNIMFATASKKKAVAAANLLMTGGKKLINGII